LRNKKYWRERTLETERTKIAQLIKDDVYQKIFLSNRVSELGISERIFKLMKTMVSAASPTQTHLIRRLRRKIRRMENGTYRRRNGDR